MSEWSIVHPWKGCVLAIEPGVRISPCPPFFLAPYEVRTRVFALRTQRPRPLDEGDKINFILILFRRARAVITVSTEE